MKILCGDVSQHSIIVMDGTNQEVLKKIKSIIEEYTIIHDGELQFAMLDKEFPTMLMVSFKTDSIEFGNIRRRIDYDYPGLCVFDAPMPKAI